jgi:hypothetical protein
VSSYVLGHIKLGDVLGMHDGIGRGTFNPTGKDARLLKGRRRAEVAALPDILTGARARGLTFTTASTLVAAAKPPPDGR